MRILQIALLLLGALGTFSSAHAERRALVIGIKDYQNKGIPHLVNSLIDADLISAKLSSVGFQVSVLKNDDATAEKFAAFWQKFKENTNPGDEVVVYFSGHGFSKDGSNFIALQDMPSPGGNVPFSKLRTKLVNVSDLSRELEELEVQIGVIILEACRENIFDPSTHALIGSGGLIVKTENKGTVVWYAASNGEVAKDADNPNEVSKGSTFTRIVSDNFDNYKNTDIERYGKEMRKPVNDAAQPIPQHSEMTSNIFFDWCFASCGAEPKALSVKVYAPEKIRLATNSNVSEGKLDNFIKAEDISNNAIFLGKKSSAQGCENKSMDGFPFGCELLSKIISSEKQGKLPELPELKAPIATITAANVRKGLPTVQEGQGIYACIVKTIPENSEVKISSVISMSYAKDTFYWGVTSERLGAKCVE